jgi:uncharacterized protein YbjT (DUF2867 family)
MLGFLKTTLKIGGYSILTIVIALAAYVFWLSGSSHQPSGVHQVGEYSSPAGPVLVFGGNRASGLEIVRQLRERGEEVVVAVRPSSDVAALDALGVATVYANALDAASVQEAFAAKPYVAVISTLGTTRGERANRPDFIGNRNVIDAAVAAGVRRMILVTVIGAGDSAPAAPLPARNFLEEVIALKTRAEEHLQASGLDYTIIRPGGLGDVGATGTAILAADPLAFSYISRKDLAALVVQALGDPTTSGKIYAAYDPSRKTLWKMYND